MRRGFGGAATTTDATFKAGNSMTQMLSDEHQQWLEERGFDLEVATRYGIFTDRQSQGGRVLAIPYRRDGKVINHKYRGPGKKLWQDAGAPRSFWNEDALRDSTLTSEPLVICEGELDGLAAIQAGFLRTISVVDGANSNLDFVGEIWPLLKDVPHVILAGDGDEPGRKLNAELARRFGAARCAWVAYPEGAKDLNDVLRLKGAATVAEITRGAKPYPIKGLYKLSDYPDIPVPATFETDWPCLKSHLLLWRGEFVVITGVPSHGKSRFALELLGSMARLHGHRAVIASFEMRISPYVRDILREHYCEVETRNMTLAQKREADAWIEAMFSFIDQDPREETEEATLEWLIDRAGDAVVRHGVDWFLLDPWNQIEHKRRRGESEADYQGRAIVALKRFARSYDCGVVVAAHPTKEVKLPNGEIRQPTLYDVSGSAHWYNAADHGLVVCGDTTTNIREVVVEKSRYRSAGVPGSGWLRLDGGRLRATVKPSKS
jgi:twinkle protein